MKGMAPETFFPHFCNQAGTAINLHRVLSVVHRENSHIHSIFQYRIEKQINSRQELKE